MIFRKAYQRCTFGSYQRAVEFAETFSVIQNAEVKQIGTGWSVYAFEATEIETEAERNEKIAELRYDEQCRMLE